MASDGRNMIVVFNFYETITPSPNYPSFLAGWKQLGKFVETLDHYMGTQLQKNTNPNGKSLFFSEGVTKLFEGQT